MRHVDDDVLRSLGAAPWQIDMARPLGVASALVVPLTLHGKTANENLRCRKVDIEILSYLNTRVPRQPAILMP
jgi:hypothetical protein